MPELNLRGAPARPVSWAILATLALLAAACGDDPTAALASCAVAHPIAPGDVVPGALGPGDARFEGAFIDYYALRLDATDSVAVTLSSVQFDPFLYLLDSDGGVLDQAFDTVGAAAGEPETATLSRRLDPGCHLIGASSWEAETSGVYSIRIDRYP